jgi:hypothetical protein
MHANLALNLDITTKLYTGYNEKHIELVNTKFLGYTDDHWIWKNDTNQIILKLDIMYLQ